MAKKKRRGSRKAKSIPVLPLIPVVAVAAHAMKYAALEDKLNDLSKSTIGYSTKDGSFDMGRATPFLIGEVVAIVGHKVANKVGVNNMVRRASMGFLSL